MADTKSTPIIVPRAGHLLVITSETAKPALIAIEGLALGGQDILVTSFSQGAQVAHQVSQTVGGPEYLYAFGDLLQDLSVGIIAYARQCSNAEDKNPESSYEKAWQYYSDYRLRPGNTPKTVRITFAGVTLSGVLLGFKTNTASDRGTALIRGELVLKGWTISETSGGSGSPSGLAKRPTSGGQAPGATSVRSISNPSGLET